MPEPQLADAVIDHDEMVAFGWPELLESSGPLAANTPRSPDPYSAANRRRRRVASGSRSILAWYNVRSSRLGPTSPWCGRHRVGRRPMQRTPATPEDCPVPPRRRPGEDGSVDGRTGGSTTPSTPRPGAARWRTPAIRRSKNPPTPGGRTEEPDPAAPQPSTDEPDHGTTRTIQPMQVVDHDEQGPLNEAWRNSANDALNTARRSGAGQSRYRVPPPTPLDSTAGGVADHRTAGPRFGGDRRS